VRASTSGARHPVWAANGVLTYWDTSQHRFAASATREEGGGLLVADPRPMMEGVAPRPPALAHVVISVTGSRYDVDSVSNRLLVLETSAASVEPPLSRPVVVMGWADALKGKLR
jgi:hypothetical protein